MRCENSVYSIMNIVSVTFDSIRKENPEPQSIQDNYDRGKLFFKFFLFVCAILIILVVWEANDRTSINVIIDWLRSESGLNEKEFRDLLMFLLLAIPASLLISILFLVRATWSRWTHVDYYDIHGLRVIFVNNLTLYFVSRSDSGFIKETIDGLEEFISNPAYRERNEMIVNFSDRSVNINEVKNSNVVGGDVQGDVSNG